ncbi:FAD-dependent oxidoreductase [Tropicimonas sp. IMCC34011]|uniref:hydroxysqualene dehydroxylase n=1 Tax=Tropicimonas sp. IMCC34011 TaxID=2248759 RepID=UPI000E21EF02|nr:FAD-dependent oxidoreductase [Tropicimonas sp. IMCC34011]
MAVVHVVGAGLAGLSAALRLVDCGANVQLWEATGRAGGRAWSFHDRTLGALIDNGNHLVLSGNRAVLDHCRRIGSFGWLDIAPEAALPFHDLATGADWVLRVPSLSSPRAALPPGIGPGGIADLWRIMTAGAGRLLSDVVRPGTPAWHALWEPLSLAVLNAPPDAAAARPLAAVLARTILRGGGACRPVTMPRGLGPTLVDPAVEALAEAGVEPAWRHPLTAIEEDGGRAAALVFGARRVDLGAEDRVILAVPAQTAGALLGLPAPSAGKAILNAHFRVPAGAASRIPPLLGLLSGRGDWAFRRGDVVSVTVSGAEPVAAGAQTALLADLWSEVARATELTGMEPLASRLLVEKAATFAPDPASLSRRLPLRPLGNVVLAGDHMSPPLPATIEGALRSARHAASAVLKG